jgi:hypothetical protein
MDIDIGVHSGGILWRTCVREFGGCRGGESSFANVGGRMDMPGTSMATSLCVIEDEVDDKF